MESLNRTALDLVDEAIDFADELNLVVHASEGDATVLDFGVEVPGGLEAGQLLAEIQTAGLSSVHTRLDEVAGAPLTYVDLSTDHPAMALLAGQKAGWELSVEGFEALGSGPARALVAEEDEYARIGYEDDFDFAVLALECTELPTDAAVEQVADMAGVGESNVFLPAFRTGSVTGSVIAAARAAETAVFRLSELGYDPLQILSVNGTAPVAPVGGDEQTAIARTTDALAYGAQVHLVVEADSPRFEDVPSTAHEEYGTPLAAVFEDVDWDFYEIPESVFGPAQVTIDVVGGPTHVYGDTHEDVLAESFEL
ncbi:methenyltetrahydromethanopterin cyclohydrolase [Haloarculaceae archaeon H-GB2-1]|nr:methenyltetrahydromethanopterin cyclohydrolase [Haloarculaceae archaeon H-GB1-1]MEA5387187.1 methenyltetrahydromethanopterin cyclohydrolase [Haloarculaceae archaeon H-GB11]MEA5408680.1 methenyltetrahydromethanopterin cyclohydrolase [Haloarculaceae archaeon H-GB2-1]